MDSKINKTNIVFKVNSTIARSKLLENFLICIKSLNYSPLFYTNSMGKICNENKCSEINILIDKTSLV